MKIIPKQIKGGAENQILKTISGKPKWVDGSATGNGDESAKQNWQSNYHKYTEVPMGYGTRGIFYKSNGIVYWWMFSNADYGNGTMGEKIPERYLPRHNQTYSGTCINNARHTGNFTIVLETNGNINKRGTTGHNEYHISGSYMAKNWD